MTNSKDVIERVEQLPYEMRTWTSTDGRMLEAEFVSHSDGVVTLKKSDGSIVRGALAFFSDADREYARTDGKSELDVLQSSDLPTTGKLAGVVDGDTLRLETGARVRLMGVDTPETVHPSRPVEAFGKEARAVSRKHLRRTDPSDLRPSQCRYNA
jgi:hypothetical protein